MTVPVDPERFIAGGYLPASFLDWDGHVAAVVFTRGCNFRCPWCHNSELVLGKSEKLDLVRITDDIRRRKKFLDGVVLTGGEPTLWSGLFDFIRKMKELEISVKLDTNGSMPEILERLLEEDLASHVAMDVKSPIDRCSLKRVTGVDADPEAISKSIALIKRAAPSYEFRTTFIDGLLTIEDMKKIRNELDDDSHWVIQPFRPVGCLDPDFCSCHPADPDRLKKEFPDIRVRG